MSCGYHFQGGGYLNKNIATVAVDVLENKSSAARAGVVFTNALIREILQESDTKVVDQPGADTILRGKIKSITFTTLTRSTTESVVSVRVSAVVDLTLTDKDGGLIWSVKDFSSYEDYDVASDKVTDDDNKEEAVEKIANRNAEKFVVRMLVDF
jgi:outer membrane lipopolysaccharide assembly protein LptE/RlpB